MKKNDHDPSQSVPAEGASEEMTVELDLENGAHVTCAVVTPLNENGQNEDGEVWFYRYFEEEDHPEKEPVLEYIEDDDEYEAVTEAFDEYLDSVEFDEMLDDED